MSRDHRNVLGSRARSAQLEKPYPPTVDVNPANASVVLAGETPSVEERNRALHEAAQAASRRTQLLRAERKITQLLALLRAGAEVGDELRALEEWKAGHEAEMRERGQLP